METNMLLDTWSASGEDYDAFKKMVAEIDNATAVRPIETDGLTMFSVTGATDENVLLLAYDEEQTLSQTPPKRSQMKIQDIQKSGVTTKFLDEIMASKLLLRHQGHIYFTSGGLSCDLGARAQVSGTALCDPTPERTAYLMHRYVREPVKATLVVRRNIKNGGKISKVFAMRSAKYHYIPQSALLDIVDYFREEMGEIKCVRWEVSHTVTKLWLEFPAQAKDMADLYKLPDTLVPGVLLETSDTGDCSFRAVATWSLRHRSYSRFDQYAKKHEGEFEIDTVKEEVKNSIFRSYTKLPERLCELLCIDVPNPADLIDVIFEKTAIQTVLGKRRSKPLLALMQKGFDPSVTYTAYDIALRFLELPERYSEEKFLCRELESFVATIPFLNFHSMIKLTSPLVLIPA